MGEILRCSGSRTLFLNWAALFSMLRSISSLLLSLPLSAPVWAQPARTPLMARSWSGGEVATLRQYRLHPVVPRHRQKRHAALVFDARVRQPSQGRRTPGASQIGRGRYVLNRHSMGLAAASGNTAINGENLAGDRTRRLVIGQEQDG